MHIARHRRGCARYFHAQILILAVAALIVVPALAAGPGGPVGPVVAPPKSPSTPAAPAVVAPTAPVIPQAPVVMPNIPSVTTGPGAPTGTAKTDSPTDDANSGKKDGNGTPNAFTATVTPTTTGGGVPTGSVQSGIADQANASTLTSYLRIPDTQLTPGMFRSNRPLLDVAIVVKKHSGGNSLQVKTDSKGDASIGKLMRGESYDIQISGKDLEPALDRIAGGKTNSGTAQPQKIIGVLVALLLPAVQKIGTIPSESSSRAFARGSKDQAIHLTLAVAKDGKLTADWGDGSGKQSIGQYTGNTTVNMGISVVYSGDSNL